MHFALLLSGLGCSDDTGVKDSEEADADADTDADSDSDTDADTDTTSATGNIVTGSVVGWDGSAPADMSVQICDVACYSTRTEADGSFAFDSIPAGDYKIDVVGESLDTGLGHSRVPYTVVDGDNTLAWTLYAPKLGTAGTLTSGTHTFDSVSWTVNADDLSLPLGYDTYDFNVGVVDLTAVPDYWGVAGAFAITFVPFDTGVDAAFDISVSGQPDAAYEVYSVGSHGELVDLGPSAAVGGSIIAAGIQPEKLTWLVFAPL